MKERRKIHVRGIVQGVGFRPFIHRLALELGLSGYVYNTTDGVDIEIEGSKAACDRFMVHLYSAKPPASRIDSVTMRKCRATGEVTFSIRKSATRRGFTQISPDIATCLECRREMFTPSDRRYLFPFINCTNCGPRYSIIRTTPYDRARTSMAQFHMCAECAKEFKDVMDRRFHAQPDCCEVCGPQLKLYSIQGKSLSGDPIQQAAQLVREGTIIAIKGLGGYHIACDATDNEVVVRLRKMKNRPTKPFAIMVLSKHIPKIVYAARQERRLLTSPIAPVILMRKKGAIIAEAVAPANPYLGVMLPYTPLHYLLLQYTPYLVMTSANIQDEPIIADEMEIEKRLGHVVSYYLAHNRRVENRCDDSVGFYTPHKGFSIIRRSRGYVPVPLDLPAEVRPTLAVGPYLKNTFVLAHRKEAYMSPHIGDLDNLETMRFFHEMVDKYKKWFKIEPELVVHDRHPDYLSTKIAREYADCHTPALLRVGVQHHVAHMVSCLGEHRLFKRAIGIIFDGTGYGDDEKIWGGEFFVGDFEQQQRVAHLAYLPLPGGEASIKKPYRISIAYVYRLLHKKLSLNNVPVSERNAIIAMVENEQNVVYTSSMGRLFDCVAGRLGLVSEITYEAEAAINLEYLATTSIRDSYSYSVQKNHPMTIDVTPTLAGIERDIVNGVDRAVIAARFHNTIVRCSLDVARMVRTMYEVHDVCLSGGVFQNRYLFKRMIDALEQAGFTVHVHNMLPTNDGCISYGQIIVGNMRFRAQGARR